MNLNITLLLLHTFMELHTDGKVKIYNEISLQLELGLYLRERMGKEYNIRFERNVSSYAKDNHNFIKREIDIVLFKGKDDTCSEERYAIELKFPRNGQYPIEMFEFIKDIKFMEEVKEHLNFQKTYCLTIVDDHLYYLESSKSKSSIYSYFRVGEAKKEIPCKIGIIKPTGDKEPDIKLEKAHTLEWLPLNENCDWIDDKHQLDDYRYYIIGID